MIELLDCYFMTTEQRSMYYKDYQYISLQSIQHQLLLYNMNVPKNHEIRRKSVPRRDAGSNEI